MALTQTRSATRTMKFKELAVLLPCHSLEDFPQHHEGQEAEGLLANWTALWHPALVASANSAPTWYRIDDPPEDVAERLLLVPSAASSELPTGYVQRTRDAGGCLIRDQHDRAQIIDRALSEIDALSQPISNEVVADFLALGYAYLQIQLLTRQMRYSSNLDESHFFEQLVQAARLAVDGDEEKAREKLTACFDLLGEERDHYYSVDAYLIDLTLLAPQTLGTSLRDELQKHIPVNLLLSGEVLSVMAEQDPETLAILRQAFEADRVGLLGGEITERCLPLMSQETVLAELKRGAAVYETQLGRTVEVYGRRRFGLTPTLPPILDRLGFQGVLHATLDDGRFPQGSQAKTRWEAADGSAIDSIAKPPLDASKPETFLGLANKLGESMDMDHVATLCLAHWPGHASPWYDDLRRAARYGAALGKFITVQEYFRDTYMPGHLERFEADQYQSPYLKQAVQRGESDPISSVVRYWQRYVTAHTAASLNALAALFRDRPCEPDECVDERSVADLEDNTSAELETACAEAAARFSDLLPRRSADPQPGYLIANPWSFPQRLCVDIPHLERAPELRSPVYALATSTDEKQAVVDVPPLGFVWLAPGDGKTRDRRKGSPPLAEDLTARDGVVVIRNEFFEALINPTTGALQSLKDYHSRGNRLSQQLAFRLPDRPQTPGEAWQEPDERAVYSVMAADMVRVTRSSSVIGEATVEGRLLDPTGRNLASFRQVFRAVRGSRVLQLDIELDPLAELGQDPWGSYYACRFAWADETAELSRSLHQSRFSARKKRIEAPQYLEIKGGLTRTAVLTAGLPYHQRIGYRMLDTLLVVRGEQQRSFRLGIGVDLPNPMPEALALLAPTISVHQTSAPPAAAESGWLFHIDSRSVLATHWEPLREGDQVVGFRTRLLETMGKSARAKLSSFRRIASSQRVDFRGQVLADCQIDEGRVMLDLTAHEWSEFEARWE